jgi:hypothetical protein
MYDRRVRVGILYQDHLLKVDGKTEGVEIERAEAHRVALQARIHLPLHVAAQGFIDEKADHDGCHGQERDRPD